MYFLRGCRICGGRQKQKNNPPRKFYISYLPHFISLVVACGIVVDFVSSQGVITHFLTYFGMEPQNLLSNKVYYIVVYVLSGIWKNIGWGSIIYLATLSGVDQSLYEAAAIDGAGRFQQIRHITLPALVPIISIQLIMRMGQIMSMSAEKNILLYSPVVYDTADTIASYVFRAGMQDAIDITASEYEVFLTKPIPEWITE